MTRTELETQVIDDLRYLRLEQAQEALDFVKFLLERMQAVQITSFRQLAQRSNLSRYQINKIRRGEWESLSFVGAARLARVLNLSLQELFTWTSFETPPAFTPLANDREDDRLEHSTPVQPSLEYQHLEYQHLEYQHLEHQLQEQATTLNQQFQREALQHLESWLCNWPKVVYAVQYEKPDLLAAKVLPLLRPLESLLQSWGVEPIGKIGDRLPYLAQEHRIVSSESSRPDTLTPDTLMPGTLVEIRRPGYRHQGNLLFRAEVQIVNNS